jgi:hypothetical protein
MAKDSKPKMPTIKIKNAAFTQVSQLMGEI